MGSRKMHFLALCLTAMALVSVVSGYAHQQPKKPVYRAKKRQPAAHFCAACGLFVKKTYYYGSWAPYLKYHSLCCALMRKESTTCQGRVLQLPPYVYLLPSGTSSTSAPPARNLADAGLAPARPARPPLLSLRQQVCVLDVERPVLRCPECSRPPRKAVVKEPCSKFLLVKRRDGAHVPTKLESSMGAY